MTSRRNYANDAPLAPVVDGASVAPMLYAAAAFALLAAFILLAGILLGLAGYRPGATGADYLCSALLAGILLAVAAALSQLAKP